MVFEQLFVVCWQVEFVVVFGWCQYVVVEVFDDFVGVFDECVVGCMYVVVELDVVFEVYVYVVVEQYCLCDYWYLYVVDFEVGLVCVWWQVVDYCFYCVCVGWCVLWNVEVQLEQWWIVEQFFFQQLFCELQMVCIEDFQFWFYVEFLDVFCVGV